MPEAGEKARERALNADNALRMAVATYKMCTGRTQKQIAEDMGIAEPTLSKRLKRPGTMKLNELRKLADAIGMTDAQRVKCL